LAGEVIGAPTAAAPKIFVIMPHLKEDNETVGGQLMGHYMVRKKTGSGTDFAFMAALKFVRVSGYDYFQAELCGSGDPIHAYCMTKPATTDTLVHILGPLYPPFADL
jgi:hypothetical protein